MKLEILCRKDGPVHRALTGPTVAHTHDRDRAQSSPWPWREERMDTYPYRYFRLTPLGVLGRLVGLQLRVVVLSDNPRERETI